MRYRKAIFKEDDASERRTVYMDPDLDPELVIPAGTSFSNGQVVREQTTNLELMKEGRAPFIRATDEDGQELYVPVELHHTVQGETNHGASFWESDMINGPVVELRSDIHDENSRILHYQEERRSSFRVDTLTGEKSEDAIKYDKFRRDYWKARAREYEGEEGLFTYDADDTEEKQAAEKLYEHKSDGEDIDLDRNHREENNTDQNDTWDKNNDMNTDLDRNYRDENGKLIDEDGPLLSGTNEIDLDRNWSDQENDPGRNSGLLQGIESEAGQGENRRGNEQSI